MERRDPKNPTIISHVGKARDPTICILPRITESEQSLSPTPMLKAGFLQEAGQENLLVRVLCCLAEEMLREHEVVEVNGHGVGTAARSSHPFPSALSFKSFCAKACCPPSSLLALHW